MKTGRGSGLKRKRKPLENSELVQVEKGSWPATCGDSKSQHFQRGESSARRRSVGRAGVWRGSHV